MLVVVSRIVMKPQGMNHAADDVSRRPGIVAANPLQGDLALISWLSKPSTLLTVLRLTPSYCLRPRGAVAIQTFPRLSPWRAVMFFEAPG